MRLINRLEIVILIAVGLICLGDDARLLSQTASRSSLVTIERCLN